MTEELKVKLENLPDSPGCYLMKSEEKIIYVGKAKNLKNRVRQYFQSSKNHSPKVRAMVEKIDDLDTVLVDGEVEALMLECNLIKLHRPYYNILLKDDKQYPYLAIDLSQPFPEVVIRRTRENDGSKYFGPYLGATIVREMLDAVRQIFPIRTCKLRLTEGMRLRPCVHHEIGQCLGPCAGLITSADYHALIEKVIAFLNGRYQEVLDDLKARMKDAAVQLNYERAAIYRDRIYAVEQVMQKQKATSTRDVDQDVIAASQQGEDALVSVLSMREGKLIGAEHYTLPRAGDEETCDILAQFMLQHYQVEGAIPRAILLPEPPADVEEIEQYLSQIRGVKVSILTPERGDKKRFVEMAVRNNLDEASIRELKKQKSYARTFGALKELQEVLNLPAPPRRIEGYDISNTQGAQSVGSMVVMIDGIAAPKEYRHFRIKTVEGANDFASMREVISRRFIHGLQEKAQREADGLPPEGGKFSDLPDLILIDGGRGQLNEALGAMREAGGDVRMFGLAKRIEEIVLPEADESLLLDRHSEALHLIQRLRDEAHRFGITHHRKLRAKHSATSSLDNIPGVGPKKKKALLKHFKTVEALKNAPEEELSRAEGVGPALAKAVRLHFHPEEAGEMNQENNTEKGGTQPMGYTKLDAIVASYENQLMENLKKWIAIPSVNAPRSADNAPFGLEVRRMLDMFLEDARAMGFDVKDFDGYCGQAEMGAGEKTMGILAHLDVVPAGEGWVHEPFAGTIDKGRFYGRGITDDKGPALAALYAMRAVREAGIPLKHRVRMIAGCDEETGMTDMAYYRAHSDLPDYGFSPDAEYPLINIEKGGQVLLLTAEADGVSGATIPLYSMEAGERVNVVPGTASAVVGTGSVSLDALKEKLAAVRAAHPGFDLKADAVDASLAKITATGVSAHASMPHLGMNAAGMLLIALHEIGAGGELGRALEGLATVIGMTHDGAGLGIAIADELSGALTSNLGILRYDGRKLSVQLDDRYPLSADEKTMHQNAAAAMAPWGVKVSVPSSHTPLHVPADSEVVRGLLEVYHEATGLPAYPVAIGGGTYSRTMPNTVAFGIGFPGDTETCHMPDENAEIDKFMLSVRIMARAIARLAGA